MAFSGGSVSLLVMRRGRNIWDKNDLMRLRANPHLTNRWKPMFILKFVLYRFH